VDENDRTLILRAQQGDVGAFSEIVERYWVYLVRLARSVVGEADAEDAVQEGLITAWRKLPGLKAPEAFTAWVVRIISRGCFRRARRRKPAVPLTSAISLEDKRCAEQAEAIDVEGTLAALPPRQRAVMHLTVIEGMSDSEIGAALGISAAGVRSHRRRARETLLRLLRWQGRNEESRHERYP